MSDDRATDADGAGESELPQTLSATDAFELLAHETRMAAVRALWESDRPLRYSEVVDRAGISRSANFNYHFRKLVGEFVRKQGEQYVLTHAGRKAMTAVLAGDVTGRPAFDPGRVEELCPYCGADVVLRHDGEALRVLCPDCPGAFRDTPAAGDLEFEDRPDNPPGTLTLFSFPPGGLRDRDPANVLVAGLRRLASRYRDMVDGLCPDCGGPTEATVAVCADHDDGVCRACGSRFAGQVSLTCVTCRKSIAGMLPLVGLADPEVRGAFQDHGRDLLSIDWDTARVFLRADERIHSVDPVDYEAVWSLDGESVAVRIGDDATVTAVRRE